MPKLTLAERLQKAAERKARAEQEQARLKIMQRKERTRRLIDIGGLAVKAGIDTLPAAALYDRFLAIAAGAANPATVAEWERAGSRHFQREEDAKVVAVARFVGTIETELAASLRSAGFRWNRLLHQWEGKVDFTEAKALVEGMGGTIEEIEQPATP